MSKGKTVSVQQYCIRREEIVTRMHEIADLCEKENMREMTDAEKAEVEQLKREMNVLDLKIASADKSGNVKLTAREIQFDIFMREAIKQGVAEHKLQREAILTSTTNVDGMIPLTIEAVQKPLEEGLILNQLGISVKTGLAGDYCWPYVGSVEATVEGEGEALDDAKVDFKKMKPQPKRVGITVLITNQTINQTDGVAYNVVLEQLGMGVTRLLNKRMFGTANQTDGLAGPFMTIAKGSAVAISTLKTKAARKAAKFIAFAGELPTYKELLAMRGIALAKGVEGTFQAYIMDEYTKAMLEATPRDTGSGLMIIENGKIAGVPVMCTNYINDDENTYIGFGCWGYEAVGGFGEMRLVIDPYTEATKDAVRMTLNSDWSMSTLRDEAFVLGKCTAV